MAYKEILPQTNLDAVDIRDTIGCPSNNLAHYCVRAKIGGTSGYAFRIVENGFQPSDGYLISGASPFFNIYSSNCPSEWVANEFNNAVCRLRRNIYGDIGISGVGEFNSSCYCFDLGAYRGYKHKSKAPTLAYNGGGANLLPSGQYEISIGFFIPGDYEWSRLAHEVNKSELYYSIESSSVSIPHNDSTMTPYVEAANHFGISVTWVGNRPPTTIKSKLGLYRKQTTDKYAVIAYIPMESSDAGNSGGNINNDTNITINPTPKPMAITGMDIVRLLGHPYQTHLRGYTVGTPENNRNINMLNYRMRWKPDLPIKRSYNITGYVTVNGFTVNASVGMSEAPNISSSEAGNGLEVGDKTWYFSGSIDISDLQYMIPRPESLTLHVQDVEFDPQN